MMQKKEQEVYFALQGNHSKDNMFATITFLVNPVGGRQTNIFLSLDSPVFSYEGLL